MLCPAAVFEIRGRRFCVWGRTRSVFGGGFYILESDMSSASTTTLKRPMSAKRRWKAVTRKMRELGSIGSALVSTGHPYMAHIVPMRRCNLACTYCNEFDDVSEPVPLEEMLRRIDDLGRLGTSVITISGGEPLLHPDLDQIIARIRKTGAIAGMITNGYLLMPDRIERLNKAGLEIGRAHV